MNSYPQFGHIKVGIVGWRQGSWHELLYAAKDGYRAARLPPDTGCIAELPEYFKQLAEYIAGKIAEESQVAQQLTTLVKAIQPLKLPKETI